MKTCAIVGINWGDEGKGRMVDLVAEEYDMLFVTRAATMQDTPSKTTTAHLR